MNPTNPIYYLRNNGWFTSSLESVTKETFKAHQTEKYSAFFSPRRAIQTLAIGILTVTQSVYQRRSYSPGAELVLPALSLHFFSHISVTCAQTTTLSPTPIPGPQGNEFQVNTYTTGDQRNPSVAPLGGGFVVAWESYLQDGSGDGVYGQRFDRIGAKVGSEFQVNTYTTNNQTAPSVASLVGGGFIIAWESYLQDGDGWGVYGQQFNAAGAKVGNEFQVNTYISDYQLEPTAASLAGGNFVVTWQSGAQDGDGYGVYGQQFNATGGKVGSEFQVNTYTTGSQYFSQVAALSEGGFVVTWGSYLQDGDGWGVYGQQFNAAGAKVGNEFQVNTYTTSNQWYPSVASLERGGFVVTWMSDGQDGSSYGIYGQRFDGMGVKVGSEFKVNTYTTGYQGDPSLAPLKGGGFVVTWVSQNQDGTGFGVYGQLFDETGSKVGSEFQINTYTVGEQYPPSVASLEEGGFVVMWGSEGQDGSGYGVYGQRFDAAGAKVGSVAPTTNILEPTTFSGSGNLTTSKFAATNPTTEHSVIETKPIPPTSDSNIPLIAGLAAAVGALVCSLLGGIVFYMRQKSKPKNNSPEAGVELGQHLSADHAGDSAQNYVELPPESGQIANREGDHYLSVSTKMKKLAETPQESSYIGIDNLESFK